MKEVSKGGRGQLDEVRTGRGAERRKRAVPLCRSVVHIRVENGQTKKRDVKIGHSNAQEAEVLEVLKPGETVIRHPANQIEEGARVTTE